MFKFKERYISGKHFVFSVVLSVMLTYFVYHMLNGNRGLAAYFEYIKLVHEKALLLSAIESEQRYLENKVHMLYPSSLDLDFLDEVARNKLGLIAEDEKCILNYKNSVNK